MNNNYNPPLKLPEILIFTYRSQSNSLERFEINKGKSKWTWPIELWLYPLFWYSNSIEIKFELEQSTPCFFFNFISLDFERICRYFRFNFLIPRFSRGINCYSRPLQRNFSSKSQDKSPFQYLSLITDQGESLSIYKSKSI